MLQCGYERAAEALEKIAINLFFKGEDKTLLSVFALAKIDIDTMHRHRIIPELVGVGSLKLNNEKAGAGRVPCPEAGYCGPARNLANVEVRAG